MLSYKDAFHSLRQNLQPLYDSGEATAIASEIFLELTGIRYAQSLVQPDAQLDEQVVERLKDLTASLLKGMPLQYALGVGWFMNRKFTVNENVLIPRPETEELVQWIVEEWEEREAAPAILDIGTGSGCIPISLKLAMDKASVSACDISEGALEVARLNANALHAAVDFKRLDFLDHDQWAHLGKYDVIVSNPPYIPINEKQSLHSNVRDYEPGTALFVPENDALHFYREIAAFGKDHLADGGCVYCELHRDYAEATKNLFLAAGYRQTEIRKDINGHWRMLTACL